MPGACSRGSNTTRERFSHGRPLGGAPGAPLSETTSRDEAGNAGRVLTRPEVLHGSLVRRRRRTSGPRAPRCAAGAIIGPCASSQEPRGDSSASVRRRPAIGHHRAAPHEPADEPPPGGLPGARPPDHGTVPDGLRAARGPRDPSPVRRCGPKISRRPAQERTHAQPRRRHDPRHRLLRPRRVRVRPRPPGGDPLREPDRGRAAPLRALPRRGDGPRLRGDGVRVPHLRESGREGRPHPARGPDRGRGPPHRARLRPRRHRPRDGGALDPGGRPLADGARGRPPLRARHGRQQGTAHHQHGGAPRGARDARAARLQRQVHGRDRRGERLGGGP